ncbi:MAG: cytochrome c biogenesis protein DipZ [Actinobacteria bacterium]|nr:cytochrome c biogenesis protein DipZ [Actinomycetota bacterium]MBA3565328.1 cytochrome c biogenesis protein DipZ [Actinomycetota bacterium]MDQ3425517.1 cytochrome c biogenesis protein DipZ [Actinomycetota bacterium]
MLILLGVAFVAGVITSLSPCMLPVLPLILAGSASSMDRRRPYVIIAGLVLSFTVFTLAGGALLTALGLPEDLLRDLAIAAMLVMAASLLSRRVAWLLERPLLFLTRRRPSTDGNGLVLGLSLGLVFVPCAGPVLAAVTVLSASGDVGPRIVLMTGAYAIGAAIPMLAIAIGGQRLTSGVKLLRTHAASTRMVAGALLGVGALAIAFGLDQKVTTALPAYGTTFQEKLEENSAVRKELRDLTGSGDALAAGTQVSNAPRAPEFQGLKEWQNTPDGKPLSIAGLRGRVVIVDFWTYSCINCLRTLPHLKAWDKAYRRAGLTIVGVHAPEFAFERVPSNVRSAVKRLGLPYPVALDNDFATWRAYNNDYWPAKYLIDKTGRVRYTHFGEGAYGETESWIRRLLGEKAKTRRTSVTDETPSDITTPESYLGYARLDRYAGSPVIFDKEAPYRFSTRALTQDELAYSGRWTLTPEHARAGEDARLQLRFQANDIFLVLAGEGRVQVRVDGRQVKSVAVSGLPRLYTLARFPKLKRGLLELRFSPGVEGYAFTFG